MFYFPASMPQKDMEYIVTVLKVFLATTIVALLDWCVPIKGFVATTLMLVAADLFTGIAAASHRKEVIHSRGLRRSVVKFCMYMAAIFGARSLESVYFPNFPMVFTISCYICVTEFYSVLENVGTVTNTNVLESVREYLGNIVKKKTPPSDEGQ